MIITLETIIKMFRRKKDEEFERFKSKLQGFFKDWEIDKYRAKKDEYSLWIANGYSHFRDDDDNYPLLRNVEHKYQYAVWVEMEKEIDRRADKRVKRLVINDGQIKVKKEEWV